MNETNVDSMVTFDTFSFELSMSILKPLHTTSWSLDNISWTFKGYQSTWIYVVFR